MEPYAWQLATASVRGASHVAASLPNQDAVGWRGEPATAGATPLAVAVADGHGDPRHFRSERGARLAVDVACELAANLGARIAGADATGSAWLQLWVEVLPAILDGWRSAVAEDLARHPFSAEEAAGRYSGEDAVVAYGSTLLLALLVGRRLLLAQIGDGDILAVRADGVTLTPVPSDPSIHGRYTTSLCQTDALSSFRVASLDLDHEPVVMLVLATDGFGNAQTLERWHERVGADLLALTRERGLAWVERQVPVWAGRSASAGGSGDDTTLALLAVDDARP